MAGRVYRVPFNGLGLTTVKQDLFAITTTSSAPCILEEIRLDPAATSISEYTLSLSVFTGSYTAATTGTTVTAVPASKGDTAATTTAKVQNTTQTVVGTGTKTTHDAGRWNIVNGWAWQPLDPDHRIVIPVSACCVLSLDTAPNSETVSGCLVFRELV